MNNDRELLELAAKAIGRRIAGWNQQHGVEVAVLDDGSFWQPLSENHITDCMGDALRLAVKLRLSTEQFFSNVVAVAEDGIIHHHLREPCKGTNYEDRLRATRRAIVRAAAEIGRGMK